MADADAQDGGRGGDESKKRPRAVLSSSDEQKQATKVSRGEGISELVIGDRLEVKWDIVQDGGSSVTRWWGCKLAKILDSSEEGARYEVLYDAYDDFSETPATVTFLENWELLDEDTGETLFWRIEGDDMEPASVTMVEIQQAQEKADEEAGESIEEAALEEFSKLPRHKQIDLASSYRSFADKVKQQLRALHAANGDGYEITSADISSVIEQIQPSRATQALPASNPQPEDIPAPTQTRERRRTKPRKFFTQPVSDRP